MDKLVVANDVFFARVTELLALGQKVTIPVKGYSMLPFIKGEKDLVELEKADSYVPGDIVLFNIGGRYILHRIVSVTDGIAWIRGDGVSGGHEECPVDRIFGKAVKIIKKSGRVMDPYSEAELRKVRLWDRLLPVRRWILAFYRRMPWIKQSDI